MNKCFFSLVAFTTGENDDFRNKAKCSYFKSVVQLVQSFCYTTFLGADSNWNLNGRGERELCKCFASHWSDMSMHIDRAPDNYHLINSSHYVFMSRLKGGHCNTISCAKIIQVYNLENAFDENDLPPPRSAMASPPPPSLSLDHQGYSWGISELGKAG